jgi:hypothetical protein
VRTNNNSKRNDLWHTRTQAGGYATGEKRRKQLCRGGELGERFEDGLF